MNLKTRTTASLFASAFAILAAAALAACTDPAATPAAGQQQAGAAPQASAPNTPPVIDPPAMPTSITAPAAVQASASPLAQAIDAAGFAQPASATETTAPAKPAATAPASLKTDKRNRLIRAQVLLDRARFTPGVIDGQEGGNLKLALTAFQKARNLTVNGKLDEATFNALTAADGGPAMTDYTITAEDVAGPFTPKPKPEDYEGMAKLERLNYATPLEALAEKFHMDEALLTALNPGADFAKAGTVIVVAAPRAGALAPVAAIEVDKALGEVRAYDDKHVLIAVYPATVGSTERPAPTGEWAVRAVAPNPTYTYDPARLTYGKVKKKLTIAAGPNNPVGGTWIDLTMDTFGIHGAPDPRLINKRASHGCVRLTNWDARELGAAVKKGAKVTFTGAETRATT